MNYDSKQFIEKVISKVKKSDNVKREEDDSVEIKIDDKDIRNILNRTRLRKALKDNLIKDLKDDFGAKSCETNSICLVIPKDKIDKTINKYSDI